MKNLINLFTLSLILVLSTNVSHSQDTNSFYDYGWLKMMHQGEDFKTIYDTAIEAYKEDSNKTKEKNFKHYARWQNFWLNRVHSSGDDIENNKFGMFYHHAQATNSLISQSVCDTNHPASNWEDWSFDTRPLLDGSPERQGGMGVMNCVKIDTSDANLQTLYAGSPIGGLWKTTDQGDNWFNLTDITNSPGMGIADIDIDPYDNQHLLVATGTYRSHSPPGVGVIESFDGGNTWDTTGLNSFPITSLSPTAYVDFVAFHPTDSNRYFAGAGDSLYLTTNQGASWDNVILSLPNTNERFTEIKFHPVNPDTFYVSSGGTDARIYRTVNGGSSFTDITSNFTTNSNLQNIRIDVAPTQPNILYATIKMNGGAVVTYENSNIGGTNQETYSISGSYFGGIDRSIFEVHPNNTDIKLFGNIPMGRSINGGQYVSDYRLYMHDDMRGSDMVNGLAAIAHDGGISISTDNGASWSFKSDGLNVQQNWAHDVNDDFTYIVSAMQDIGFYSYDIASDTWEMLAVGEGGRSMISEIDQSTGLVNSYCGWSESTCDFGVKKYLNSGDNIVGAASVLPKQWHDFALRPLVEFPNGDVYTGLEDVFISTDFAGTWSKITDFDGTGFKGDTINDFIVSLDRSDIDTNLILAAYSIQSWNRDEDNIPCSDPAANCPQKKLILSRDKGSTWSDITKGSISGGLPIEWTNISQAIFSPHDPGKIWVSFGGYYEQYGSGYNNGVKVYYSPDTGKTWSNISYNLPNFPVNDIVYHENSNDRIYVATDAGVFTKEGNDSLWQCYNNNLPPAYVMHLDINDCGGALTASTHGRGIWKSPLAPNTLIGDIEWEGNRRIGSDLIIEGNLTIKDTVEMAENTKIIVKTGGSINIDGGVITSSVCNNSFWQGIELEGYDSLPQHSASYGQIYQPYLLIENGGEISNARVAVRSGLTDDNGDFVGGTAGGMIVGLDATFKNNLKDIIMHPYQNYIAGTSPKTLLKDVSRFTNCSFISDTPLPNNLITAEHINIDGIDGLNIEGCTLKNELAQSNLADRGTAIRAVNSSYEVIPDGSTRTLIEGFFIGVDNYASNPMYTPTIKKTDFIDNVKGALIAGSDYATVVQNKFEILDASAGDQPYGLYLNWSSGYEVEENNFTYTGGGTANNAVGLVVMSSNNNSNEIYHNNFDYLHTATLVHGDNKIDGTNDGLKIKCNDYDADGFHIALESISMGPFGGYLHPEIALNQGGNASQTDPAGNTFNDLCNSGGTSDIFISTNGSSINYFHHLDAITTPLCTTASKVTNVITTYNYQSRDESCPSNISSGGGGGIDPGLGLVSHAGNDFNEALKTQLSNKSSEVEALELNDYVRLKLLKDTIEMDSVILALAASGTANNQMRMIAAMARKGDTTFNDKSFQNLLTDEALNYIEFTQDLKNGGKRYEEAKSSIQSPYFMWAKVREYQLSGEKVPSAYQLPQKRIRIEDENKPESSILIYPNPTDEQLTIELNGYDQEDKIQLDVLDLKGSLLKSVPLSSIKHKQKLSVAELKNGVYLLNIFKNGELLSTKRFNVQH